MAPEITIMRHTMILTSPVSTPVIIFRRCQRVILLFDSIISYAIIYTSIIYIYIYIIIRHHVFCNVTITPSRTGLIDNDSRMV